MAPRTAGSADAAGRADATVADQPGRAPRAAGHTRVQPGRAVAAVAVQQPTGSTGLSGRRPVGAVANERAPQNCLGWGVDETQHLLLEEL